MLQCHGIHEEHKENTKAQKTRHSLGNRAHYFSWSFDFASSRQHGVLGRMGAYIYISAYS
jgi:hypothetical protein